VAHGADQRGAQGSKRKEIADLGYENLKDKVDAIISINNDRILQIIDKKTSLVDAFKTVDDVLKQGISGISDLITTHGLVNADFADVKSIMQDAGTALMGIGVAVGENRAEEAAKQAINSPLLELTIDGAKGVLFNITSSSSIGMHEVQAAANVITKNIDSDAKVKFGTVIDESLGEEMRITVIATGFDETVRRPSVLQMVMEDQPRVPFIEPKVTSQPQRQPEQVAPVVEVRRPLFSPRPAETQPQPIFTPMPQQQPQFRQQPEPQPMPNIPAPDDELDIPAFIRKKMK
jgi:cell division protein FtsZ